ncbi:MAG: hypothetical protein ACFCU5_20920 [Pleurocapsa sp.]
MAIDLTKPPNDTQLFQNFCKKYFNRVVREHFKDIGTSDPNSLDINAPRALAKRLCLHKNSDTLILTIGRLLLWWFEMKGLFDEPLYGMPSTEFHINYTIYPQLKLHFKEDKYEASLNRRRPARSEVSVRWREEDFTTSRIKSLANQIALEFGGSSPFSYRKGREVWTYWDNRKGYQFKVAANSESEAKSIIRKMYRLQDSGEPDWNEHLRQSIDKKTYGIQETMTVMGDVVKKPKKRPVATVYFAYAELFIAGMTQPIVLVDRTGTKPRPIKITK